MTPSTRPARFGRSPASRKRAWRSPRSRVAHRDLPRERSRRRVASSSSTLAGPRGWTIVENGPATRLFRDAGRRRTRAAGVRCRRVPGGGARAPRRARGAPGGHARARCRLRAGRGPRRARAVVVALAGAEDALAATRDALLDPTVVVARPAPPETHHACPPTPEPAIGAHVFVLWGVAEHRGPPRAANRRRGRNPPRRAPRRGAVLRAHPAPLRPPAAGLFRTRGQVRLRARARAGARRRRALRRATPAARRRCSHGRCD